MNLLGDISCASNRTSELCAKLSEYGVARIEGFLSPLELAPLQSEARRATVAFANYQNPYGPCARFSLNPLPPKLSRSRELLNGEHLQVLPDEFTHSRRTLDRPFFHEAIQHFFSGRCGFMEVVAFTRDYVPDRKAVYGQLHFDRRHQLKFIIYLNDVYAENGAFACIPASHTLGRDLFYDGWSSLLGLESATTEIVDAAAEAVAEDSPTYRLLPCVVEGQTTLGPFDLSRDRFSVEGAAGTLVAFDTHLLHCGGFVLAEGKERWTLKGHTFGISA